ncbi:MAG: hypothetical protein AAGI37_01300 [Planctomycetota bacterium]
MPNATNPNLFEPPTADQLAKHLQDYPAIQTGAWQQRGPILMLVAIAGLALLMIGQPGFALLPLLGLLGVMAYLSGQARTAAELQGRTNRVWELAMIRQYREALGQAWELLPLCRAKPELHGRAVTVIAHVLGELGQDDAAEVAYGYLLDRLPPDHPIALRLRLQRAMAALTGGRLADGDDILRRLRGQAENSSDPNLSASFRMARLIQDVQTGHYAEALGHAKTAEETLNPLGVEAGYGYALYGLCCDLLAGHDPSADEARRDELMQHAKQFWDKATLLIPASALIYRFGELNKLSLLDKR